MNTQRANTVMVSIMAALIIPRLQRWLGITLTLDDVGDLLAFTLTGFHYITSFLEARFPPKV